MGKGEIVECERVDLGFLSDAPIKVTVNQVVACTGQRLWDILADGESWTRWVKPIVGVEWTSPKPLGIGATRTVTMVGGLVGYEEYLAWDAPRHFAFRFNQTTKGGPEAFVEEYRIYDLGNGSCKVSWTMAMRIGGPSARMPGVVAAGMKKANASFLKKLASYAASNPVLADD